MRRKLHPHVEEELRIAERSVGLNSTCADCGEVPGYNCRKHFVADLDTAKALLARAHAMIEKDSLSLVHEIADFLWSDQSESVTGTTQHKSVAQSDTDALERRHNSNRGDRK